MAWFAFLACDPEHSPPPAGAGGSAGESATGGDGAVQAGRSGCSGAPTLGRVTPATLNAELAQSPRTFLLINVHIPFAGNIPGTDANIAYDDPAALEALIGPDKSRPVTIYCLTNYMSRDRAGPVLVEDGYCQVRYLDGGLSAWQSAGYPVVQTAAP